MEYFHQLTHRLLAIVATLLLSLAFVSPVSSQTDRDIYTWTDEEGVRHFSAYPPQDTPYEIVEGLSGARAAPPPPPTGTAAAGGEMPEIPEMRETEPDPEVVAARCEQARTNLNLLRQDRPAILRNEDGDPTPLEGERRQEMIEETEAFIDEWC
ncbi:MAG: DUF4124 domain-containing protein [Wenzhouxiangella sp.]|jgi:hypothetical protein|nr:DUF4124 domain-containing protein [Wenzhouxiangella sp.]